MLAFVVLLGTGCSGINVGGSASPAMFFIPGAKAAPSPTGAPAPVAVTAPSLQLALAR